MDLKDPWAIQKPGNDLLSHTLTGTVSSVLEGLTSVFGMGTGVAPPERSPGMPNYLWSCLSEAK